MNMLQRLAEHYVGIKTKSEHKYHIMARAQERGHRIKFDVLYYAKNRNKADIIEEIGAKEGEYIRKYMPPLNT